jgi:O-antigen ligase/polysaccharide polymerase Wzy-like membrane protein
MNVKYKQLLAVLAVLIFFTNLDLYLFEAGVLPSVPPLYWVIGFALLATPLLLSRNSITAVLSLPTTAWCLGFSGIAAMWLFFQSSQSDAVLQEFRLRLLSAGFVVLMSVIFSERGAQISARWAILFAATTAVAINIYELFLPLTFSHVLGRSAGLYLNPTISGMALVLGMIFSVELLPPRYRGLFTLFIGVGVLLTLSRGSMAGWIVATITMLLTGTLSIKRTLFSGAVGVAVCCIMLMPWWGNLLDRLRSEGIFDRNVLERVEFLKSPQFSDGSALERQDLASRAWNMFADRPFLGNGVAASKEWGLDQSSHNQYLNLMTDHGILGILILPLLVLSSVWRARDKGRTIGYAFATFILCMGFFSHNILDERYCLLGFSLMVSLTAMSRLDHRLTLAQSSVVPGACLASSQPEALGI